MNLRRHPLLLAAAVGLVLLAAWWWPRSHGPTYQGRDVRGWLAVPTAVSGPSPLEEFTVKPEMLEAFRQMGPDAIPVLAEVAFDLHASHPRLSRIPWLRRDSAPRWMAALPDPVMKWLDYRSSYLPEIALAALRELRPPAALLFPSCTNRLSDSDPWKRTVALKLLPCVANEREVAARLLVPYLAAADPGDSESAWRSLSRLGPAAVVVVPNLITWLTNQDSFHASKAVDCLRNVGPGASNALPVLRHRFTVEKSPSTRLQLAVAAAAIDPGEFWATETIRAALTNGSARGQASHALSLLSRSTNVAPIFERELVALTHADEDQNQQSWMALNALCRANLDLARKLPVLTDCLGSTNGVLRTVAAGWLLDFQPANARAFTGVTNALANNQPGVAPEWLLTRLTKLGPAAAPALPLLRQLLSGVTPSQREPIEDAIHALEGAH